MRQEVANSSNELAPVRCESRRRTGEAGASRVGKQTTGLREILEIPACRDGNSNWSGPPSMVGLPPVAHIELVHAAHLRPSTFARDMSEGWRRGWDSFPSFLPHQRFRPDRKPSNRQIHSKPEYQVQNRYSDSTTPSAPRAAAPGADPNRPAAASRVAATSSEVATAAAPYRP